MLYATVRSKVISDADEQMKAHVDDLYTILDIHVKEKQNSVNISLNLAHSILNECGGITETDSHQTVQGINQITKEKRDYQIPIWHINNTNVYNDITIVDKIKSQAVETATIFQKIDDGYLRVSTNVMKLDGTRAVNTFIPNSSNVIKTIEKGETFYGRAFVVNDWYLTAYEPIRINGVVKGILFVGVKEKDYAMIKKLFSNKRYYTNGYPFIIFDNVFLDTPSLKAISVIVIDRGSK